MDFAKLKRPSYARYKLETLLGPVDEFIATEDSLTLLRDWAQTMGYSAPDVYAMSNVALVNLYHEHGPSDNPRKSSEPTLTQKAAAELIARCVEAMSPGVNGIDAMRSIIREEIPTADTLQALARAVYDDLPPRKLEVSGPAGTVTLGGAMHHMTQTVIRVCGMGHHIMMVGPAGCGKTTIARHCAKALNLPFYITSTVSDTHELLGFVDGYGRYNRTPFREAFENGGVWVADEIDAWDAAALLTANSALANGFTTFPDMSSPVNRHANFRMIATANTFGNGANRVYVGRNELDAASLDRFAVISVGYDSLLEEQLSNGNPRWLRRVWEVRNKVEEKNIRHVVSSRAIIFGSEALQVGFSQTEVEDMYLFKGMSAADRSKVS